MTAKVAAPDLPAELGCDHSGHEWVGDRFPNGWMIYLWTAQEKGVFVGSAFLPDGYQPQHINLLKALLETWAALIVPPVMVLPPKETTPP